MFSVFLYLAVGIYAGRKVKHLDDYYVAGRNASTLLIVGFVSNASPSLLKQLAVVTPPVLLHPIVVGAALSLMTILIVSRLGSVTPEEQEYRRAMHVTPKEECGPDEYKVTLRRAKWLKSGSVVAGVIVAVFYATPY